MNVGVTRPRDGMRPPVPAELMAASLALPAWDIAAGSLLGGSGEAVIC